MVLALDCMADGITVLRAVLAVLLPFGVHGVVANVVEPVVFSGGHGKEGTEVRSQNRPSPPPSQPFRDPSVDYWAGLVDQVLSSQIDACRCRRLIQR